MDDRQVRRLWEQYHERRDDQTRDQLLRHYQPLADRAARALGRGRSSADREDLQQEATLGLLRAIEQWDPNLTPNFAPFAGFKCRIAGINHIRAMTWCGKTVVQGARRLEEAEERVLARNYGRAPTEAQMVAEMGLTDVDELHRLKSKVAGTCWRVDSLDASPPESEIVGGWHEVVADDEPGPAELCEAGERSRQLRAILGQLCPLSREILTRRFLDREPSKQIAASMGLHESRISQLSDAALREAQEIAFRRVLEL